jgi:citrate synthase
MSEPKLVPKGLYGVAVCETSIAKSISDGSLTYRGYDISDLFESSTFEETAFLVLNGTLPSKSDLNGFFAELKAHWKVPDSVYNVMRDLPKDSHPMDMLRTAVSALGANERKLLPQDQKLSLIAKMPWLVANSFRISRGKDIIQPDQSLGTSDNLLYMLTDKRQEKFEAWAFERELILYMEHDLNASAFAVRVIASTLADVYAACTGGVAALRGPLHGGANEAAMDLLLKLGKEKDATTRIQEMLARGEKVMGFGHRVYKIKDPRAQMSKHLLRRLLKEQKKPEDLYNLCEAVEKKVWEAKKLPANLDFYAAPIFYELGIPIEVYTPIFAASRVVGWVSHYNEQMSDNKIFRPDAVYNGKSKLEYVSIEKRS